ncbi:MAG: heme-binding protein [Pirellulaceae bacterium]|nr:MAG: heme-binding protein [Pirellulaceae bacterium]
MSHKNRNGISPGLPKRLATPSQFAALALAAVVALAAAATPAQEAYWIWSSEHTPGNVPAGASCHFRKQLEGPEPESGKITIAADDSYELFVNGRFVGRGSGPRPDQYDITPFLSSSGVNLIAVKVTNLRGNTAGLAARILIKDLAGPWRSYVTDRSWRTNLHPLPLWQTPIYNDRRWDVAQTMDRWTGDQRPTPTPTPDRTEKLEPIAESDVPQFEVSEEFEVIEVLPADKTGSVLTFTFNEFGHLVVSRENGSLLLARRQGEVEWQEPIPYAEKVKNCQGVLALNGELFVTGDGPDGPALYRLSDRDRDGRMEHVRTIVRLPSEVSEHGAHGVVLGPDGYLYVILGNHARCDQEPAASSPYRDYYEGDLVPRYEDPSGHAQGIKAPGGVVLRTDLEGRRVELFAGGLRNAYHLVFHPNGELFVHDSDMEFDIGTPWYRPTQLFHVVPGGEYGWRSGWAKWPAYFVDSLPGILDTGRGSPTGAVVYDHFAYPSRYHGTLFLADWSEGRILNVKLEPRGAGYTATSETFLTGSPLNVTALDVGPDGSLYFSLGGRGTRGGIYRVRWRGTVPAALQDLGQGISRAIRQPQFSSAWARQAIATTKDELGSVWSRHIVGVARSRANPPQYRTRALDIMQLFGPPPSRDFLVSLAEDPQPEVRAKAAELMGLHANDDTHRALLALLEDPEPRVRRKACEALLRAEQDVPYDRLRKLLLSEDRFEAWAARRLLERQPVEQWQDQVLAADNHREFIQGSLALLIAHPSADTARTVIERIGEFMEGFVADQDFIDMLRLAQVAILRGQLQPDELSAFAAKIGHEFPAANFQMNRELIRLIAYLQVTEPMDRFMDYLDAELPLEERLHLAFHLRFLKSGWRFDQKLHLLDFLEEVQLQPGGGSYPYYVRYVERDFAKGFSDQECLELIERGESWPSAAVGALYRLPKPLDPALRDKLIALDRRLLHVSAEQFKPLRVGIVAVLAQSPDETSQQYLRDLWESDPERRAVLALALAQHPDGPNWNYLVRSIPLLEGDTLAEVLRKLIDVPKAPAEPEYVRHLILAGLRLGDTAHDALALLEYWTGEQPADPSATPSDQLKSWQKWFAETYPDQPEPVLPASEGARWQLEEVLQFLTSEKAAQASAARGAEVFTKAQCAKCHRFGDRGDAMGPDLTSISKRFTRKETLQSILFPSYVISDQYAAKVVVTTSGKTYTGIVSSNNNRVTILQTSGEKVEVDRSEVEQVKPSRVSAMPSGLLDGLTLEEIADLFAFLGYSPPAKVVQGTVRAVK